MPEVQPSVAEKIERQVTMATDADAAATERRAEGVEGWRTHIRQFPALEIAPDQFDRVQLRGVAWQTLDAQPRALLRQVTRHPSTLMSRQPVPDQDDRLAPEVPLEVPQEGDQRAIGVAARLSLKKNRAWRPSHRKANAPATDRRFQLPPTWVRTGVSPRRAHVR